MELLALFIGITVALYAYAYWRMFSDERPRQAPVSHLSPASMADRWERVTTGWSRQRPM